MTTLEMTREPYGVWRAGLRGVINDAVDSMAFETGIAGSFEVELALY